MLVFDALSASDDATATAFIVLLFFANFIATSSLESIILFTVFFLTEPLNALFGCFGNWHVSSIIKKMKLTIAKLKSLIQGQQHSVLSAPSLIMIMIVASRLLGLVRQRVLAHYFIPDDLSLFFASI